MSDSIPAETLGKLREALAAMTRSPIHSEIVEPRDAVFARYQPVFSAESTFLRNTNRSRGGS